MACLLSVMGGQQGLSAADGIIMAAHSNGHWASHYILQLWLLHGTRAVGVSQILRRGTRNGIMELSLLVICIRGRHLYYDGGRHVGHRPI